MAYEGKFVDGDSLLQGLLRWIDQQFMSEKYQIFRWKSQSAQ